ncbi:MAG: type II CAAX endopeptidase family protein [Candidatus Neomarinimicrobiota bacterium]
MKIKKYFINQNENRLRTGWRILLFLIIGVVIAKFFNYFIKLIGGPPDNATISEAIKGVVVILIMTISVWISRKYLDKKSLISLGIKLNKRGIFDLFFGFTLSGIMIVIIYFLLLMLGYLSIENIGYNAGVLSSIITILVSLFSIGFAVAWSEELVFRGYLLQNLTEGIGIKWAAVLSSIFFGLAHMLNPNASVLAGILITILTFLLVVGWLRTGQLWVPIGLHAGWNFFMGPVFGFPVSGHSAEGLVNNTIIGPEWITGGEFGPEGGIIVLPVILVGFIVLFFWTKTKDKTPWTQQISNH